MHSQSFVPSCCDEPQLPGVARRHGVNSASNKSGFGATDALTANGTGVKNWRIWCIQSVPKGCHLL